MNRSQIIDNFLYVSDLYLMLTGKDSEDLSDEDMEALLESMESLPMPTLVPEQHIS